MSATLINASPPAPKAPLKNPVVSVLQSELDDLRRISQCYANLCANLVNGGVDHTTIELLSYQFAPLQPAIEYPGLPNQPYLSSETTTPISPGSSHTGTAQEKHYPEPSLHRRPARKDLFEWSDSEIVSEDDFDSDTATESGWAPEIAHSDHVTPPREEMKSIKLLNLPHGARVGDITSVIRGGQLANIAVRARDRSALVSFVHEEDAQALFDHVQRHDLYIKQKRVDIEWASRHFSLPTHVLDKIRTNGATRNLVIRNCNSSLTEASVRDHLNHIHNLIVISVSFLGRDCFISTNSVSNAMFARTCMMSRQTYRSSRVEWAPDECDQPLSQMPQPQLIRHPVQPEKKSVSKPSPYVNRFDLLKTDE